MKFEPIHEIPADGLSLILNNARQFIEWNIEPRHCHLHGLMDSIKESLIHFLPDDEDLIKDIHDANEATLIINTFAEYPHPLKEGLIALREIFEVINTDGGDFYQHKIKSLINDYLETIESYVLKEKLDNFHLMQRQKRAKRQTWKGLTREEMEVRDEKILELFRESKLNMNAWSLKYANVYNLSPRQIRNIIKKHIGS